MYMKLWSLALRGVQVEVIFQKKKKIEDRPHEDIKLNM